MTSGLPPSAQKDFERAVALFQQGRIATAEGICSELLARFPEDPEVAHFGGVLATRGGRLDVAIDRLGRCVRLQPARARAHAALAFAQEQSGRIEDARQSFEAAVALEPGFVEAHNGLGIAHQRAGRLDAALRAFERALAIAPDSIEARINAGRTLLQVGRHAAAAQRFREALARCGEREDALRAIALGLQQAGDFTAASAAFSRLLEVNPGDAGARGRYALVLDALGREDEARLEIERALAVPQAAAALYATEGAFLAHRARWPEAAQAFRHAVRAAPTDAATRIDLALALRQMGLREDASREMGVAESEASLDAESLARLAAMHGEDGDSAKAIELVRAALRLSPFLPDAHRTLAAELLRNGRLEEGWRENVFRPTRGAAILEQIAHGSYPPRLPAPLAGADIALLGEQGLGDVLFFLRYASALGDADARLHLHADRRLEPLIRRALPVASWFDGDEPPRGSTVIWAGDLPLVTQGLAREPAATLRIAPLPERVERMRARLEAGGLPVIALAWRAGTQPAAGPIGQTLLAKEVKPALLGHALAGMRARFVSIQRNPRQVELDEMCAALGAPLADLSSANEDLEDMLALAALLDDYVGVSSTNVHLRAAAGGTGRILVPHPADWRWQVRGDSPWFPGFTAYRQDAGGDWSAALGRLAGDLAAGGGS
jgi:tetratricopeptide (TPR) repeat protein